MPRKFSLSRADFAKTRGFRRLAGASLSVSYGQIPARPLPGGAIVVSKKVAKSAVTRNRLKRTLRPILLAYLRTGAASAIVTVRKDVPSKGLRLELEGLLAKIPLSP
jgi:ribonuclease P protein component